MQKISFAVAAALAIAPASLRASSLGNVWTNTAGTAPVMAVINPSAAATNNGPWTLGLYNAPHAFITSPQAQTDYCYNATENLSANPAPTAMAPFYFPFIIGEGQNLFGLFDYRPSSLNEITVAAKSADGGKSWTWLQQALQVSPSTACPTISKKGVPSAGNNDTGLGHPFMLSFAGANFLYLLDRRGGHVDNDGLVVKRILPTVSAPLHASPALDGTIVATGPANLTGIIAGWDFTNYAASTLTNTPAADQGPAAATATASAFGMTNNYWCSANTGTTLTPGYGSIEQDDVLVNSGSSVQTSNEWRVRGAGGNGTTNSCNGWDLDAPQYSQGAQFTVDTTGVTNVLLQYDWYTTAQGFRDLQVQYSLNAKSGANAIWTNIGPLQIATPKGYNNQLTVDFTNTPCQTINSQLVCPGNNPNFGIRFAGAYDPTLLGGSFTDGDYSAPPDGGTVTRTYGSGQEYSGATVGDNDVPTLYNDNSGNWRFSNVGFYDATKFVKGGGATTDYTTETTGLLNPDGLLAVIPNSYPVKVLYVQKQLQSSLVANNCPTPGASGTINYDVDTIRLASTKDGVHFTDLGATNLLDPTTTSNFGIRYAAPNGSVVKYASGQTGLFFGAGNCQDGDSDGFHAIVYAEAADNTYLNWTYVNNMNNPVAEVSYVNDLATNGFGYGNGTPSTPPLTGTSSETNGGQNYWFGGRTYNPNAVYQDAHHVSLIFAGYNYGYFGTDLASYRTIGQITLTSSKVLRP
jgi:hypothetical protein